MTDTAELRRLLEAADEGEWTYSPSAERIYVPISKGIIVEVCKCNDDANAALIVAMKNALPELLLKAEAFDRIVAQGGEAHGGRDDG